MRVLERWQRGVDADIWRVLELARSHEAASAFSSPSATHEASASLAELLRRLRDLVGSREVAAIMRCSSSDDAAGPPNILSRPVSPQPAFSNVASAEVLDYEVWSPARVQKPQT